MEQSLRKKTYSSLIWKFCERFSAQFVSLVVSIILARMLMPEDYGIVALVTIFITIANVLVTNGMGTALIQNNDADDNDFSTMFWASFGLSIVLYMIVFFSAPIIAKIYDNNLITIVLRIMGLRIPLSAMNSIQQAYVSKKLIFRKFFVSTMFGTIASAIVGIALAFKGYGVWALVWQYLVNCFISTIVLFFTLKWRPKFVFDYLRFKVLFSYAWKIMAAGLIGTIFNEIKGLIVGTKYDSESLAYYNKGDQIPALIVNNVNSSIESVAFPVMSKIQGDKIRVKSVCNKMIKMSNCILMPMLFGLAAVAEPLVIILLTEKWLLVVPFIQILCLGKIFSITDTINTQAIKAIGKSDTLLKLEFIKKPVYLTLIVIGAFISPLGIAIFGAVYSIIGLFINLYPNVKYLGYKYSEQVLLIFPQLAASAIMCASVLFFNSILRFNVFVNLFIEVLLGVVIYFIATLILDKKIILDIISLIGKKRGNSNEC